MSLRIELTRTDVDQLVASTVVVTEDLISQRRFTPAGRDERDFLPVDLLYGRLHWVHSREVAEVLAAFTGGTIYFDDADNQLPLVVAVPASAFPGESCTLHSPLPCQDGLAIEWSYPRSRPQEIPMQILSSWTTHPSTPESYRQETVLHTVKYLDDAGVEQETRVMARDPIDAMDRLRASGEVWP